MAELDEKIIVFKKREIHAFSGRGPNPTGAGPQFTETFQITSDVGCQFRASVVKSDKGLLFQSEKGIFLLTRGLDVQYIGAPVEAYTLGAEVVKAFDVERRNHIIFFMRSGDMLVYDHLVNQWSTYTSDDWNTDFLQDAVSLDGEFWWLDNLGMMHRENSGFTDNNTYIPLMIDTAWVKPADLQGFVRTDWIGLLGEWHDPHNLTVEVRTDYRDPAVADYTKAVALGTNISPYQVRFKPSRGYAKCQSFKLTIFDEDAAAGGTNQGYSLSGLSIDYKTKKGMYKNVPRTV